MANLATKDGIYIVRFRYQKKEFKRSLKTRSEDAAKAALHVIELTIHRLLTGQLQIREGADPGDFIVSGGTWTPPSSPPPPPPVFPSTESLIDRFLTDREADCADTYLASQRYQFNHFKNFLGKKAGQPCNLVTRSILDRFLRARKKVCDGETVNRMRVTLCLFYKWILLQEDVPQFPFPAEKLPRFKGSRERDPFKTVEEIEAIIERGGLDEQQILAQWECLYLDPPKIADLLSVVQTNAVDPLSFLLHAVPAYTGIRRGELLRLGWVDLDLDRRLVTARSRKQSRSREEVTRRIEMHPELHAHLIAWQRERPRGQFVLSQLKTLEPLSADEAKRLFWRPMRGTSWCLDPKRDLFKIGFHTYRHSFASNLAAAGIDERIIDVFMGHTTEVMRKRYRHLFPTDRRSAIESFSLAAGELKS